MQICLCLYIQQMKKKYLILAATFTKVHCLRVCKAHHLLVVTTQICCVICSTEDCVGVARQAYRWTRQMLPCHLPAWGSSMSGHVVVRFGTHQFRVYSHLLEKENYTLVSTVIFSVSRNNMLSWHNLWEVFSKSYTNF